MTTVVAPQASSIAVNGANPTSTSNSGGSTKMANASSSSAGNSAHLFACTKCNSRHPFEELSPDLMLCKSCRDAYVMVKCTYCRSEFQQDGKNNLSSVCRKCDANVKAYGKPTSCEYCNVIAAFIGSKCQRCVYSEKKYGPPVQCEQCKQRCAFDRKDSESRKKVDGKLLCWLCTLSYKRALAKATKHKDSSSGSRHSSNGSGSSSKRESSSSRSSSHSSRDHASSSNHSNGVNGSGSSNGSSSWDQASASKKPRVDYVKSFMNNSNGTFLPPPTSTSAVSSSSSGTSSSMAGGGPVTSTSSGMDSGNDIMNVNDNVVAVTQLREKILSLDRQLKAKNKELLNKDVKITELKSEINKEQRDCREKIQEMQKRHNERVVELSAKITSLSKQVATLSKASKKGSGGKESNAESSPLNF